MDWYWCLNFDTIPIYFLTPLHAVPASSHAQRPAGRGKTLFTPQLSCFPNFLEKFSEDCYFPKYESNSFFDKQLRRSFFSNQPLRA